MGPPTRSIAGLIGSIQDDNSLTQEDKELYLKVHQELNFMDQRIKSRERFDLSVINNHTSTIFEHIRVKNKIMRSYKEEVQKMTAKINDLEAEKQHLQLKTSNLEHEIKEQILENNNYNDLIKEKDETIRGKVLEIKEKEEEILSLKAQPKATDTTLDIEISEQGQSMKDFGFIICLSKQGRGGINFFFT
uniref:Uncharacterized protein n=1 Tax=Cacopsylla melanoneura TaxID=428564 RepID=A0A8D9E8A5_9HEMI